MNGCRDRWWILLYSSMSISGKWNIYIGAAVYQWCEFKSRRGKNKNLTALKSNSNTVWFNFQTYIYILFLGTGIQKTNQTAINNNTWANIHYLQQEIACYIFLYHIIKVYIFSLLFIFYIFVRLLCKSFFFHWSNYILIENGINQDSVIHTCT